MDENPICWLELENKKKGTSTCPFHFSSKETLLDYVGWFVDKKIKTHNLIIKEEEND